MKLTEIPSTLLAFILLSFLITSCNSQIEKRNLQADNIENSVSDKKDYELADEFLHKLRNDKVDTIIFYKRTCINCCDFYNIFWAAKGERYLTKFYFDFDDLQSHSETIPLTSDKIFKVLGNNFIELKNTSIKNNGHRRKDGTTSLSIIDHYCYAQVGIYITQDSIITDRIKDHDFDKYADFGITLSDKKEKRETNDNYITNINSKWNILLTTIENEISNMPKTYNGELETLRTRKSGK